MPLRYWLLHANGTRQLIDPNLFDLQEVAEDARREGGELLVEGLKVPRVRTKRAATPRAGRVANKQEAAPVAAVLPTKFMPPISALEPMFRMRLSLIHQCKYDYILELNSRPTNRVLGGYYKSRALVRVYTHDRETGPRPLDEVFETFLHEIAHHLEYTEPSTFSARKCGRVKGMMHSPLFHKIFKMLKNRWAVCYPRELPAGKVETAGVETPKDA